MIIIDNNICNTLKLKETYYPSHPMVPWDREPASYLLSYYRLTHYTIDTYFQDKFK